MVSFPPVSPQRPYTPPSPHATIQLRRAFDDRVTVCVVLHRHVTDSVVQLTAWRHNADAPPRGAVPQSLSQLCQYAHHLISLQLRNTIQHHFISSLSDRSLTRHITAGDYLKLCVRQGYGRLLYICVELSPFGRYRPWGQVESLVEHKELVIETQVRIHRL